MSRRRAADSWLDAAAIGVLGALGVVLFVVFVVVAVGAWVALS